MASIFALKKISWAPKARLYVMNFVCSTNQVLGRGPARRLFLGMFWACSH